MNGQSAAKLLSELSYEEGSTTIETTSLEDKGVEYTDNSGKGRDLNTTFIYALAESNSNNIRYVGKADDVQQRFKSHLLDKRKTHKASWIKSLDKNIEFIILDEVDRDNWQFWEIYWISQCKAWGFNLTNHTIGGDGCQGFKQSDEQKLKTSIRNTGKKASLESRQKISEGRKGMQFSDSHIRNLSESHKGLVYPKGNYGKHCKRGIAQYENDKLVKTWTSLKEAAEFYNVHQSCISRCCSGKKKGKIKGFIWKYLD